MKNKSVFVSLAAAPILSFGSSAIAESGFASRYSDLSTTASGRSYAGHEMVAAHPRLPFGTKVKVHNRSNGKHIIVTIVDRGPFVEKRIIDLSPGAAKELGVLGVEQVDLLIER